MKRPPMSDIRAFRSDLQQVFLAARKNGTEIHENILPVLAALDWVLDGREAQMLKDIQYFVADYKVNHA